MSNTFHLLTAQGNILPATYPLTITATQPGYSPLTVTISITVTAATPSQTVDTIRSITELLTVTWADGQRPKSLTVQDVRDTILSLALQTADFSRLPTTNVGLPSGRVFLDGATLRVNLLGGNYPATMRAAGAATLSATARHAVQHATATFSGTGSISGTPRHAIQHASAKFSGAGLPYANVTPPSATVFADEFTDLSLWDAYAPDASKRWQMTKWYGPEWFGHAVNDGWMVNPSNPNTPYNDMYTLSGDTLALNVKAMPADKVDQLGGCHYLTAQVNSFYTRKGGYWEARIKCPDIQGTNFAFWMQDQYTWPPEIDIVEYVNQGSTIVMAQALRYMDESGTAYYRFNPTDPFGWHTYGLFWDDPNQRFIFFFDGERTMDLLIPTGYTNPFFIILSAQSGAADWSGPIPPGETLGPMLIDYVRVYATLPAAMASAPYAADAVVNSEFTSEFSSEFR